MNKFEVSIDADDPISLTAWAAKFSARAMQILAEAEGSGPQGSIVDTTMPEETPKIEGPEKDEVELTLDGLVAVSMRAYKVNKTKMLTELSEFDVKKVRDLPKGVWKTAYQKFHKIVDPDGPEVVFKES